MKKNLSRVLVLLLVLTVATVMFAGCGAKKEEPAPKEDKQVADTEKKEDTKDEEKAADEEKGDDSKYVAFAHKSLNYYAFVAMMEGMKRYCEDKGWKFESAVSDFDSAKQTNHVINYITKQPDVILSDPIDSDGLVDALDKAVEAGIPVAIIDTPTTGGDVAITVAFDNYQAGELAAMEIIKRLEEKYGEPKGIVVNAYGAMSSWAWRLRKEGMDDTFAKYPNINYIAMPAEGDMKKTNDVLINAIAQHGTVDAVHAPSDNPALGLVEALKQKGMWKKVGEEGHVILVTIDGEPCALQGIEEGYYDATIAQDCASYGEIPLELLEKYTWQGKECPTSGTYKNDKYFWEEAPFEESPSGPYLRIPAYVIDESNYDDPRHWGNVCWDEWGIRYN